MNPDAANLPLITSDMLLVTSSNYTYVSDIVLIRDCDGRIPAPEWGFNVGAADYTRTRIAAVT